MRPLGGMELGIWKTDQGSPLNFTTVARISGGLTEALVRASLPGLRRRHSHLRSRIVAEGRGATLRDDFVPPLSLRAVRGETASWVTEIEREINGPIQSNPGPLARFTFVEGTGGDAWVLVTLHHSVGDGMSGAYLMRDLVSIAAQVASGRAPVLPALEDPGPLEERLPARARGLATLPSHLRLVMDELRLRPHGKPMKVRRDRDLFAYDRRARVIHHELDVEVAEALAARARAEKTTVHGALSAALILGVLSDAAVPRGRIWFGSPVNVRRRLVPSVGAEVGFFVSMLGFQGVVDADVPFWELARRVRRSLEANLSSGADLATLQLLPLMFRLLGGERATPRALVERWERTLPTTTGLTNLGRLEIQAEHGSFRIESCSFAASPSALGDFASTATTLHGRLHWNFIWPDPVLTEPHAQALVAGIVECARRAA